MIYVGNPAKPIKKRQIWYRLKKWFIKYLG
jgi:hypothetical protein